MAQQNINFGTAAANDGETLLTAMPKVEANFTELYSNTASDAAALAAHIADTTAAHAASAISFAAGGSLAATDVQAAIAELDSEKQPLDADLTAIAALTRTRGDIIRGGAADWERLPLGTSGYHLQSDGTDVAWAGFLQAGTGAETRTWHDKLREIEVSVDDFGAAGDADAGGATGTDDTAAFQAAIDYVNGIGGGIVHFSRKRYLIDGNLSLKANVTIRGPIEMPGHIQPVGSASYDDLVGVLYVNSAATITTEWSCGIQNGYIIRKGLVLPFADATAATVGVAAFAGTPITVSHHDARLSNLLILGFEYPFESTPAASRLRVDYVSYDCTNGPKYDEVRDVMHVQFCHGFPYTTTSQSWVTDALLTRTGTGMDFRTANDIGMVTNAFTFGYGVGFEIAAGNILTVLGCSADYPSGLSSTSVGFRVSNDALDTVLIGCSAAAQGYGVVSDPGGAVDVSGSYTKVIGFSGLDNDTAHVNVGTGRALVTDSSFRGGGIGVFVGASAGRVVITDNQFDGVTTPLSINAAALPFADIDGNVYNNCTETVPPQRVSTLERKFINNADSASAPVVSFEGDSATPANNDVAFNRHRLSNASGTQIEAFRQSWQMTDVSAGSEDAQAFWSLVVAGSLTDKLLLTGTALTPTANDGLALGTTALGWADLHLATGGVINWANGGITITEGSDALSFAGAAGGYRFSAFVCPVANDGAALGFAGSLAWSDLHLASGGTVTVNNVQVLTTQQAAVANATDAASVIARLNDLLARLRTHGIIAT